MDVFQQRSVIRFMVMQQKTPKLIHEELQVTLGDSALANPTVKKWAALFKAGRESVQDDARCGRPTTAVNDRLSVFWDSSGIVLVDFLEKGRTINGEYYASLLEKLPVQRSSQKKKRKNFERCASAAG